MERVDFWKKIFSDDVDSKYRRPIEKLVRERRGAEEVDEPSPQSPCPYCEKDYDSYEVSFFLLYL